MVVRRMRRRVDDRYTVVPRVNIRLLTNMELVCVYCTSVYKQTTELHGRTQQYTPLNVLRWYG